MDNCQTVQVQQPPMNYSGVTIQITNPTVNATPYYQSGVPYENGYVVNNGTIPYSQYTTVPIDTKNNSVSDRKAITDTTKIYDKTEIRDISSQNTDSAKSINQDGNNTQTYPAAYYMNTYNVPSSNNYDAYKNNSGVSPVYINSVNGTGDDNSTETSQGIINDLNKLTVERKENEKNSTKTRVVALTNDYIMSLENYLNNPNAEIRLMASKEILTRLDEDKNRYDDAALNALLNKMLQDPDNLVRIAAFSAFSSGLASGNDYTVELLHKVQNDPNSKQEDVIEAANILLKMSSDTDVKYIPNNSNQ